MGPKGKFPGKDSEKSLSLSSLKVIDMIFLPLSSYWENGYVWRYSSHIVTVRHQNTKDSGAAEEKEPTSCQISQGILLQKAQLLLFLNIVFTYFQRGGKGGRKRGGETSMCINCLSHTPYWGPGQQPRHVP